MYEQAYLDARKVWDLMSPKERANHFTFKKENVLELMILKKS